MKQLIAIIGLAILCLGIQAAAADKKDNFSGNWKLNAEKSDESPVISYRGGMGGYGGGMGGYGGGMGGYGGGMGGYGGGMGGYGGGMGGYGTGTYGNGAGTYGNGTGTYGNGTGTYGNGAGTYGNGTGPYGNGPGAGPGAGPGGMGGAGRGGGMGGFGGRGMRMDSDTPLVIQLAGKEVRITSTYSMNGRNMPVTETYMLDGKKREEMTRSFNSSEQVKRETKGSLKKNKIKVVITTHDPDGKNKTEKEYTLSKDGKVLTMKVKTTRPNIETKQTRVFEKQ